MAVKLTLFEHQDLKGKSLPLMQSVPDLSAIGFPTVGSSLREGGTWRFFDETEYGGKRIQDSNSGSMEQLGSVYTTKSVMLMTAQIVLYKNNYFKGNTLVLMESNPDLSGVSGFNDMTSSVIVVSGVWKLWADTGYRGKCQEVRPGSFSIADLKKIGNDSVSSVQFISYE